MAGGSSITSPRAATAAPDWEYGVFVSFRGKDTRKGFMSHLFSALESTDIRCYRDNDPDQRGRVVGPMLLDAIHGSRISLILFSTRYADSNWCLDELVEIMKCASMYRDHGHMVVPIFYDVEPSDVRRQTGKFGEGFESCLAKEGRAKEAAWRSALEHAGKRSGWHLKNDTNGDEAGLIKEIVGQIISQIAFTNSPYFINDAVGIGGSATDVISLMNNGSKDDVRVIGVFGMKGIGKTTLAKLVCCRVFSEFKGVSFLANIGDAKNQGLIGFQKMLIDDIVKVKHATLSEDSNRNVSIIRDRLSQKKILLVLDDVREKNQISLLGGRRGSLGPGSRILITTEHEQLLDDIQVYCKYMVSGLSSKDSLRLISRYAFYDDVPEEGFEQLSEKVVHYTGGLPSAIVALGSCLSGKAEDQWVKLLEKLMQDPNLGWIEAFSENIDSILCPDQSKVGPYPFKSIGPFGFKEGTAWDDGKHMDVRQITVVYSSVIESICVVYDNFGHPTLPFSHGKQHLGEIQSVNLDYPYEYLTSISGHLREDNSKLVLQSLSFHSNVRKYGPFGDETGISFSGPSTGGKIIGFYGSFNSSIVSIGAYLEPVSHLHPVRSVGPFGGNGGMRWDDGQHTDLRKIIIKSGIVIELIGCVYVDNRDSVEEFRHGGGKTEDLYAVNLDCPDEYVTSISGYYGRKGTLTVVKSLTFRSDRRVHGPFGKEEGIYFESPANIGKIVGLYGMSGSCLDCIGAYFAPVYHMEPIRTIGPYGGQGGYQWDDGKYSEIRKIFISYGSIVDGIGCSYCEEGEVVMDVTHGGRGGNSCTILLDYPDEYLISMSGCTGIFKDMTVVRSLTLQSNKKTYGPFGSRGDTPFTFTTSIGRIAGFYGRSGRYLNAIGAHIELLPDGSRPSIGKITKSSERRGPDQLIRTIGPYGGIEGHRWDDGKHSYIRTIFISYGSIIDGICCSYGEMDESVVEMTHGGRGGNSHMIELDYPDEHLQSMWGYVGIFNGMEVIRCLAFQSNKKKYGPFGSKGYTLFSFKSSIGKIVGFYGRSDRYLHSIGAHFERFPDKR